MKINPKSLQTHKTKIKMNIKPKKSEISPRGFVTHCRRPGYLRGRVTTGVALEHDRFPNGCLVVLHLLDGVDVRGHCGTAAALSIWI